MIYEYKCKVCSAVITIERPVYGVEDTPVCCNEITNRVWSAPSITFKGSGFYTTDKRK